MGVAQLKDILKVFDAYREWNHDTDMTNASLYIDFPSIAYGVIWQYMTNSLKRRATADGAAATADDAAQIHIQTICNDLPLADIANDIFCSKVKKYIPQCEEFNFFTKVKQIFIAHDYSTPIAKARMQEKRRKNKICIPRSVRDGVADEFYMVFNKFKTTYSYTFDIVYDKTQSIGEAEWKCIAKIWADGNIHTSYVLANDYDVIVGAYCLPDIQVNVIWKRINKKENCSPYCSTIINWSSDNLLEKLLIVGFLNVYGNDYVPGIITTTANVNIVKETISTLRHTMFSKNQSNLYVTLENIAQYIFQSSIGHDGVVAVDISSDDWIHAMTFYIMYVYNVLLNKVFNKQQTTIEETFFKQWQIFQYNKDNIVTERNEQLEYVVTMVLWYLCYCTNAFKRSECEGDENNYALSALPLRTLFRYNDNRTKFDVALSNKRSLFDHMNLSCFANVYVTVNTLFSQYIDYSFIFKKSIHYCFDNYRIFSVYSFLLLRRKGCFTEIFIYR